MWKQYNGHWQLTDLKHPVVCFSITIWVSTPCPTYSAPQKLCHFYGLNVNTQRKNYDGKVKDTQRLCVIVTKTLRGESSHQAPLLCISSLGCLWGVGQRSSSAGLNILFTNTLLETGIQTHNRQTTPSAHIMLLSLHVRLHAAPSVCAPPLIYMLCICARWHSPFSLDLLCVESEHLRRRPNFLSTLFA